MYVLIVAEKPTIAEEIAKILSNGNYKKLRGWNSHTFVFECLGEFYQQIVFDYNFKFHRPLNWCFNFCFLDTSFPQKFTSWYREEPKALFKCPIEPRVANPKHNLNKFLAAEAANCEFILLWLDCDREGENICFEVIDAVRKEMCRAKGLTEEEFMDRVFRARFSSITAKEIKRAMADLGKPNFSVSQAVLVRQELDLRIGCAFTRFLTTHFRHGYCDFDDNYVSLGPCQTPTLAFCVRRHDAIGQFKPQPYWVVQAEVELSNGGQSVTLDWCRTRQYSRETAQTLLDKMKKFTVATLSDVLTNLHTVQKPEALRTVEMLKMASIRLGMSPAWTMAVAEKLYTRGNISYPRTETSAYHEEFEFERVLSALERSSTFAPIVRQIRSDGKSLPENGTNKGDHPPITPLRSFRLYEEDGKWWFADAHALYKQIAHHFLATLMRPCKYLLKSVIFDIGGEQFLCQSRKVEDAGFTKVLAWLAVPESNTKAMNALSKLSIGDKLRIKQLKLIGRTSVRPEHLTEAELITLMEDHGIGTDASIPVHVENICQREFVTVATKQRRLVPTPLGTALLHGYQRVDPDLVVPTSRAQMERKLEQIAQGTADTETLRKETLDFYLDKFCNFEQRIGDVEDQIRAEIFDPAKPFRHCFMCGREMLLVVAVFHERTQQLICPNCHHREKEWDSNLFSQ
ncbi:hypothetical protein niasHT_022514 [Heterodera trifolii]|uniref:DNA topoisomerase n=1 Tax=Heterodera trifolii TaxID=157864 RepID=A0ABD2JH22_9BILA